MAKAMRGRGLIACLTCLAAVASAEDRGSRLSLSYDEALRRALAANPAVSRARAEVGFADAQRRTALSFVMPRVQATGGLIRNCTEVAFGLGGSQRVILPENDWNLRVTLTQPIFAGLRDLRTFASSRRTASSRSTTPTGCAPSGCPELRRFGTPTETGSGRS
jgi:hypothetical protein